MHEGNRHLQLRRSCFICTHYAHKRTIREENPLIIETEDYCRLKENRKEQSSLTLTECYYPHDCCLYDMHKVAVCDPDFSNLETHEQMVELYKKKYERPLDNN